MKTFDADGNEIDDGKPDNAFGSQVARDRLAMFDSIAGDDDEEPPVDPKPKADDGESDEHRQQRQAALEQEIEVDPDAALDTPITKKHKLKVDGQEQEVDEDAVIQAGIAALQKTSTADRRLEEATRLLNEAKTLGKPALDTPPQKPAVDPELIRDIQYGDTDKASAAIQKLMGNNETLRPTDIHEAVQTELKRSSIQTQFKSEFPGVFNDPDLMGIAARRLDDRLRAGEPNDYATYQAVGKELADKFKLGEANAADPAKTGSDKGEFGDKLGKKREVVRVPVASGNSGSGKKVEKEETAQSVIDEIRKARKQS